MAQQKLAAAPPTVTVRILVYKYFIRNYSFMLPCHYLCSNKTFYPFSQTVVNLPVSKAFNTTITHSPALNVTVDIEVRFSSFFVRIMHYLISFCLRSTGILSLAISHEYSCRQGDPS